MKILLLILYLMLGNAKAQSLNVGTFNLIRTNQVTTILSPTGSVAGCVLWLPPESLSALADGANVTNWNDWSGLGNHATAPAGKEPVYNTSQIGTNAAVTFTAANTDYLRADGVAPYFSGTDSNVTVFVVAKTVTNNYTANTLWSAGTNGTVQFFYFQSYPDANYRTYLSKRSDDNTALIASTHNGSSLRMTNWILHTMVYRGGSGLQSTYTNSTVCINAAIAATNKVASFDRFSIGSFIRNTPSAYLDGGIAAVVVFNSALSDVDRANVRTNYFKVKFPSLAISN